jgi:hypothetical protein
MGRRRTPPAPQVVLVAGDQIVRWWWSLAIDKFRKTQPRAVGRPLQSQKEAPRATLTPLRLALNSQQLSSLSRRCLTASAPLPLRRNPIPGIFSRPLPLGRESLPAPALALACSPLHLASKRQRVRHRRRTDGSVRISRPAALAGSAGDARADERASVAGAGAATAHDRISQGHLGTRAKQAPPCATSSNRGGPAAAQLGGALQRIGRP